MLTMKQKIKHQDPHSKFPSDSNMEKWFPAVHEILQVSASLFISSSISFRCLRRSTGGFRFSAA